MVNNTLECSIGIMAYNEEENIGKLLDALIHQETFRCVIKEIVVVASGCTDATPEIVTEFSNKDSRIKLILQEKREGKASAINLFLKHATSEIVVFESADTLPEKDVIEKLVIPFTDPNVGMTGCRIIPVNSKDSILGFYIHLFWNIHHRIGMLEFKTGEITAMRNVIPQIPDNVLTDETYLTSVILQKGYRLVYIPDAIVWNRGPETFRDFIIYRVRQIIAYYQLKKILPQGCYIPKTMSKIVVFKCLLNELSLQPKAVVFTVISVSLEILTRLMAWIEWYIYKKNPYIWDRVPSTKRL